MWKLRSTGRYIENSRLECHAGWAVFKDVKICTRPTYQITHNLFFLDSADMYPHRIRIGHVIHALPDRMPWYDWIFTNLSRLRAWLPLPPCPQVLASACCSMDAVLRACVAPWSSACHPLSEQCWGRAAVARRPWTMLCCGAAPPTSTVSPLPAALATSHLHRLWVAGWDGESGAGGRWEGSGRACVRVK